MASPEEVSQCQMQAYCIPHKFANEENLCTFYCSLFWTIASFSWDFKNYMYLCIVEKILRLLSLFIGSLGHCPSEQDWRQV